MSKSDSPTDNTSTKPADPEQRGQFGTRIGFILAAIGSAVGFGSIARFPMNAANNGGAMFLLMYLFIMLLFGIPIMIAELSMGRTAQRNTVGAFRVLTGKTRPKWMGVGFLYFLVAAFILSYYSILSGWTLRYFFGSMTGAYFNDPDAYLTATQEGPWALIWHAVVMVLTAVVLTGTVSKGIEKVNLVMMPALFLIIVGLAVYAATLPNVAAGYEFYLQPDLTAFTLPVMAAAVGQAFFSLSLGQGAMMTYASYLPKRTSLATNASIISLSTLCFAVTCGFLIFPLLSTFGLLSGERAGLGLIFGPLAQAFAEMGQPLGNIIGALFFLATFFASFTSAVSLAEPAISYAIEEHKLDRRRASILICALIYIAGIAVAFNSNLLDLEGGALTDFFVILGGFTIALYVGWFSPVAQAIARMDEGEGVKLGRFVRPLMQWVMPLVLGVLLLFSITGTPCFLSGDANSVGLLETFGAPDLMGCEG